MQQPQIEIFLTYSRQDKQLANELQRHLSILQGQKGQSTSVYIWSDVNVVPGTDWRTATNEHLNRAQIILVLVSVDLLASNFIFDQLPLIEQKYKAGTATVIPIILHPTLLSGTFLADLKPLPANGKPLSQWISRDLAYQEIIDAVKDAIENLQSPAQVDNEKKQIRELLETFSERELLILCMSLGLNIETLLEHPSQPRGTGLPRVDIDRLLEYMEQQGRINDLASYVRRKRLDSQRKAI